MGGLEGFGRWCAAAALTRDHDAAPRRVLLHRVEEALDVLDEVDHVRVERHVNDRDGRGLRRWPGHRGQHVEVGDRGGMFV